MKLSTDGSVFRFAALVPGGCLLTHCRTILVLAVAAVAPGCVHYQPKSLAPVDTAAAFEQRTLADAGLKAYLETNVHHELVSWPLPSWDFTNLILAALYFHPDPRPGAGQVGGGQGGKNQGRRASESYGGRCELNQNALARLDALVKAQQALGQMEDALQSPVGLSESLRLVSQRSSPTTKEMKHE